VCAICLAEVLCLFEDEVVLLQDKLLQNGLDRGLPGISYELADLQVHDREGRHPNHAAGLEAGNAGPC
jgi:hypothetical protein